MIYAFDMLELDLARAELRANGKPRPVEPQVFALLAYLVEHRDRLVTRDELLEKLWQGRVVSDAALASRIKSARKAVDDDGQRQAVIKTVHGQGLRFVAAVSVMPSISTVAAEPAAKPMANEAAPVGRPSIAVLPFRTLGDTGGLTAIADGLPHELITELARLRWLFVVARGSSFRLRGDELDPRTVGELLGVRYCLSGTVELRGEALTVTAELSDTRGGEVVWSERYQDNLNELHSMRADIRSSTLAALEIQIPLHEAAGARLAVPESLDAWSAYHLGLQHIYRFSRADNSLAADLFTRAVEQDPGFSRAHAGLSFVHFQTAFLRHTDDVAGATALARELALRAVDLDPLDPFVNFTMGRTYWLEGDLDRALSWLERATDLSPNYAQGFYARAWTETMAGNAGTSREHLDLAMRLSPLDPLYYAMLAARGLTHIAAGDYREAAEWTDRGARSPGAHALIAMIAAAAHVLAGDTQRAQYWAGEARKINPALTRTEFFGAFPMRSPALHRALNTALQSLGF
ncbi:transcriptional regulator [Pseudohalioglobus sediminis]|uniref:Transcriptional regulator n=2 Tax=Pseudohalioglobus sediminis TaxID=2606449 RepID=A0A5B0X406_9GAMM|nr:transcriptional regulator [Pseudohalioglobus sediminis]